MLSGVTAKNVGGGFFVTQCTCKVQVSEQCHFDVDLSNY